MFEQVRDRGCPLPAGEIDALGGQYVDEGRAKARLRAWIVTRILTDSRDPGTRRQPVLDPQDATFFFAYGSELDSKLLWDLQVTVFERKSAVLADHRIEFQKRAAHDEKEGYATAISAPQDSLEGILYKIARVDLEKLDRFFGEPGHYERRVVRVTTPNSAVPGEEHAHVEHVDAHAYFAEPSRCSSGLLPRPGYIKQMLFGCDALSSQYVSKLEHWPVLST
jgi:hypothetical protein